MKPDNERFACYDNGGKTCDRYTIIPLDWHPVPRGRGVMMYDAQALAEDPSVFDQMTTAQRGRHLGRKVQFQALPAKVREAIVRRFYGMPEFNRFDICEAWAALESDYNVNGWLHERPSNLRRRESCGVQLARMKFRPGAGWDGYNSLSENGRAIYHNARHRLGLPI